MMKLLTSVQIDELGKEHFPRDWRLRISTYPPSNLSHMEETSPSFNVLALGDDNERYTRKYLCSLNNVIKIRESGSYREAVQREGWIEAMKSELDALDKNETWTLTDLPTGKQAIDSKWVYKTEIKPDGSIEKIESKTSC